MEKKGEYNSIGRKILKKGKVTTMVMSCTDVTGKKPPANITLPDTADEYAIGEALEKFVHDDIFSKTPATYIIEKDGVRFTTLKVVKKPNGMLVIEA